MLSNLKTAILMTVTLTILTGLIYPFSITLISQIFPRQANGSFLFKNKQVIGSKLIGQSFTESKYFHSRLSESNYDAFKSGGSNLGPTSKKLINRITASALELEKENPNSTVPIDLVTASGSGLDPHITPEAAIFQVTRIAKVRNLSEEKITELIKKYTEPKLFGIVGEERVNVLILNLALDDVDLH